MVSHQARAATFRTASTPSWPVSAGSSRNISFSSERLTASANGGPEHTRAMSLALHLDAADRHLGSWEPRHQYRHAGCYPSLTQFIGNKGRFAWSVRELGRGYRH